MSALSEHADVDPLAFDVPLYDAVDPDALDALFAGEAESDLRVSFRYESFHVSVEDDHCYVSEAEER